MIEHEYRYWARLVRIIDADSLVADVDLGFDNWEHDMHVRLAGIDAPEKWTPEGKAALAFVRTVLFPGDRIRITSEVYNPEDKYGRCLATVELADGLVLNDILLEAGHAKPYDGGPR